MVGVPGRSKACHICRCRRIKCDGQQPGCRNCAKSGRTCTGYQRNHTFILSQDMVEHGLISSEPSQLVSRDETGSGTVMVSRWRVDQRDPSTPGTSKPKIASKSSKPINANPLPHSISLRNAFRERFFSALVEQHMMGPLKEDSLSLSERGDWMLQVFYLPSLTPALENALLSICTARLGRHNSHQTLVHESLKLYTVGMAQIRRDILDKSKRDDEQSLAACLALLMYEVLECPGGTAEAFRAHYHGSMKLLEMRGPGAHSSGLAHSTFQILRVHTIIQGIGERKRTFLASPEWRDLPWSSGADKTPFDRLVDILLGDIADLFIRLERLKNQTEPQHILSSAIETTQEVQRIELMLGQWFDSFKAAMPGDLYHAELSKITTRFDTDGTGKVFPVAFQFSAFIVGLNLVYYWVALLSVHAHQYSTYGLLARLVATLDAMGRDNLPCTCSENSPMQCLQHFSTELLDQQAEWPRAAASNICQSIEYFLQDRTRGFGQVSVLPALAIVKGFVMHAPGCWDRELVWIDEVISRIRASGYGIAATLDQEPELKRPSADDTERPGQSCIFKDP